MGTQRGIQSIKAGFYLNGICRPAEPEVWGFPGAHRTRHKAQGGNPWWKGQ